MKRLVWNEKLSQLALAVAQDRLTCPALAETHGVLLARLVARLLGVVYPVANAPCNMVDVIAAQELFADNLAALGVDMNATLEWALEPLATFVPVAVEG